MKRAVALLFVLGLWLGAAMLFPAMARTNIAFPALTGRVVDAADLLTPAQESQLTEKLQALETQTTDQLVVVTVPSLDGYDISDYGYQLGRHWGIGQKGTDNGAMLIVAPNDRTVRIEVGYGLEGVLTDGFSSYVIRNDILPAFREGNYFTGIDNGVTAIVTQLTLDPEEAAARAAEMQAMQSQGDEGGTVIVLIIIGIAGAVIALGAVVGAASGGRGRRVEGAIDGAGAVLWTAAQIMSVLASSGGRGGGSGGGGFGGGGGGFGGGGASGGW